MNKILFFALLLTFSVSSFSQTTEPAPLLKADYLKKARNQKTTAWILLGGGFVISSAGLIVETVEATTYVLTLGLEPESTSNTGSILLVSGAVMMLGSIPFFISSSQNKKKALTLSFKNEKALQVQKHSYVSVLVPSVSLKIAL